MELHVFATNEALDEREEFDLQMKCFIREEYGHILGEHAAILDGPRGLERFMAKYWAGLSDGEIDSELSEFGDELYDGLGAESDAERQDELVRKAA